MNYSFHPDAEKEFDEAITFYEEKQIGLGFDFAREIYSAIEKAASQPRIWPLVEDEIHRSMANR